MLTRCFLAAVCFICFYSDLSSNEVIWKGEVLANGTPTEAVKLFLNKRYQIKVSGVLNLGKWVQAGRALANDACYEFNGPNGPVKMESLSNSINAPLCQGEFRDDHIYYSPFFTAKQNRIHFWVSDLDYRDNSGSFMVEVLYLGESEAPSSAFHPLEKNPQPAE